MGRWGETEEAPGVKLWRGRMGVVKQGRAVAATTREEVSGCAGGGDPCACACGLLLQMSTTLLLQWLQLGLPLQRRRGVTRARGRRHRGSGRRGLGEPARNPCLSLFWRSHSCSGPCALSHVRLPALPLCFYAPASACPFFPALPPVRRVLSRPPAARFPPA
jgi:hypothetical protein